MDRKIPWARGVCLFLYYERPKSSNNLVTKCKGYFSCTQLLFLLQPGNQVSCLAEGILTIGGFKVTSGFLFVGTIWHEFLSKCSRDLLEVNV